MEHTLKLLKDRMQNHKMKRHTWCSKIGVLYWDTLKECKMLRNLLSNYVTPTKFVSVMKFGVKENIYVTIVSRNNDRNKRKHLYKNYESVGATLSSQYQEVQPEKVVDLMIAATFITSKIDMDIQI